MSKRMAGRWRMFLPLLDLRIEIPFLLVQTILMRDSDYARVVDYIAVEIRFYRWEFRFRLYDTMTRELERGS